MVKLLDQYLELLWVEVKLLDQQLALLRVEVVELSVRTGTLPVDGDGDAQVSQRTAASAAPPLNPQRPVSISTAASSAMENI